MRKLVTAAITAAGVAGAMLIAPTGAVGSQDSVSPSVTGMMPSEVPATFPPTVSDKSVSAIAQVGSNMVIGGAFTQIGGQTRKGIAVFDATTGALSSAFNPAITGAVTSLLPGPSPDTVFVGGSFTAVNGKTTVKRLTLLSTLTGEIVASFKPPVVNGLVSDMYVAGGRLYLAGAFTKIGGASRGGLATLNPTTGAYDPFMDVNLTIRHNEGVQGAAVASVGGTAIDVSPDGRTAVVIGNFRKADTLDRVQAAVLDLTGSTAEVKADWKTNGYVNPCYNGAYDSYMRGLSFSPDGSYFVITATGGSNWDLCDTATRWETGATGQDLHPTWSSSAGGDTLWSTAITSSAVFVGGHQRWLNNDNGNDFAGAGAVPRPGIAALDPLSGRPLTWNPGRNPRGTAVYAMLATSEGLWIGQNTDYIGNRRYNRGKLAFFPYAGGTPVARTTTPTLPAQVFVGHGDQGGATNVLYRVNAGGGLIQSVDSGPDWADDSGFDSPLRNSGTNAAGYNPGAVSDGSVPSTTPNGVFDSERWSPNDNPSMQWDFPVAAGTPLQVRLLFSNRCDCTAGAGQRQFNVFIDGAQKLTNLDLSANPGHNKATMKAFDITSDGVVDIDFSHYIENPLINGIEIVRTDVTPSTPMSLGLTQQSFNGTTAGPATTVGSTVDWALARGAFTVGDQVFVGMPDGLYRATLTGGTQLGNLTLVQPYHDPKWMNVDTGSNSTFDGNNPPLYSQLNQVGGMFYADGKLFYNQVGSSQLRWSWFSPDSGIVEGRNSTATSSVSFANVSGMFATGGFLYYVNRSTGDMFRVAFANSTVSGSPVLVNGPSNGGADWRGRAMFLGNPPANNAPNASFTSICDNTHCAFDASASTDTDGTIVGYRWSLGDGSAPVTTTNATFAYDYAAAASYPVTVTAIDDDNAESSASDTVTPAVLAAGNGFVGSSHSTDAKAVTKTVAVPAGTQVGDLLVLSYVGNTDVPATPSGWTQVATRSNTLNVTVWTRTANSGDLGGSASFSQSTAQKAIASLSVYRGVAGVASADSGVASGMATHVAPATPVISGDQLLWIWADKSAGTTNWDAPAGVAERDESIGSGAGHYSVMSGDSASRTSTGTYPGRTATTDAPSTKDVTLSLVLR